MAQPEPVAYHITPFSLDMHPEADRLEEQWIPFFAGLERPVRVIAQTTRFDLNRPRQQLLHELRTLEATAGSYAPLAEAVLAGAGYAQLAGPLAQLSAAQRAGLDALLPLHRRGDALAWRQALARLGRPLWRKRWLQDYARYYQLLAEQVELRGLDHFLLSWLPDGVRSEQQAALIGRAFGTPARIAPLPALLRGEYDERRDYLEPREPQLPLIALLEADDLRGTWSLWTFARLLDLDIDLHLCIDLVPMDRTRAELKVDFVATATENSLRDPGNPRDVKTERKLETARAFQEQADQGFYEVRAVVAVEGRDHERLEANVRMVTDACRSFMRLIRPPYGQGPLAQFFTTRPTKQIDAHVNVRTEIGHGAAVMLPFGIRRPSRDDGLLWLIEGQTPIMFNPLRDRAGRKRAGHAVVLGKTGSGKTFGLFVWAMRMLALGWQVVIIEPQGHARRFIQACGAGGAYYALDMRQTINVLDAMVTRDVDGNPPPLAAQIAQVLGQLAILLGHTAPSASGEAAFAPRTFDRIEAGLLDQALQRVYAPWAADIAQMRPEETPTIADLCAALGALQPSYATDKTRETQQQLLAELDLYLVSGSAGAVYNGRTTIDWDFTHDATAYDLTALEEGTARTLYMAKAFSAINHYVRTRPHRDRPLVVIFDEFAYTLGKAPALAQFAADAAKTWRTFSAMLVTADQDAHTYLGTEGAVASSALRSIFDNASMKVLMHQDPAPAERLGAVVDGLQPQHVQAIKAAGLGDVVLAWKSDDDARQIAEVFTGRVIPTELEGRTFSGT
ncbi:hypothetical protein F8S13_22570 [Chloroflexia bacterium SDU3-3]|nr:hypothetical protein F8S13_22570 [Chloroflexia bacterium SDU3-3]